MFSIIGQQSKPGLLDNDWPNQFYFPFGEWIKELVFWAVNNDVTAFIGDVIEWPFSTLFSLILSDDPTRTSIQTIPWVWMVIVIFLIGSFARNLRVGITVAAMLSICAFLGPAYWEETSRTIGMILVSVILCALFGIPLGVLSGRIDSVWNIVRPTLDAMQVVHPFVFMLPFIFFFRIGEVPATMVTMVFALPPIVRLTNLGIRQVPEDVVEASRAYGANEARVLFDVQLPLSRPAILAGLNQTLLLAFSMLGIAALMGAGGLGKLLLRAINSLNLGLAAKAGVAFFLVAVVLDRITQSEEDDGIRFSTKLSQAWRFRSDAEGLLDARADSAAEVAEKKGTTRSEDSAERPAPASSRERIGLLLGVGGAVLVLISVMLTWGKNAGLVASWGRIADVNADGELTGQSFNGLEASGGSVFGITVCALAALAFLAYVRPLLQFSEAMATRMIRVQGMMLVVLASIVGAIWILTTLGIGFGPLPTIGIILFVVLAASIVIELFVEGTHRLGSDGALIASIGMFGSALGYVFLNGAPGITGYEHGIGIYLALIGAAVAIVGGLVALLDAPYSPHRPLPAGVSIGGLISVVFGLFLILGGSFLSGNDEQQSEFGWIYDSRLTSLETPEFIAEIERLETDAGNDITKQLAAAQTISNMYSSLINGQRIVYTGVQDDGPQLGWVVTGIAIVATMTALMSTGLVGRAEKRRWQAATVLSGLGLALMAIPAALIASIVRTAEPNAIAGVGAFVAFVGGFAFFTAGRSVVGEFRRRKLYADHSLHADSAELDELVAAVSLSESVDA